MSRWISIAGAVLADCRECDGTGTHSHPNQAVILPLASWSQCAACSGAGFIEVHVDPLVKLRRARIARHGTWGRKFYELRRAECMQRVPLPADHRPGELSHQLSQRAA